MDTIILNKNVAMIKIKISSQIIIRPTALKRTPVIVRNLNPIQYTKLPVFILDKIFLFNLPSIACQNENQILLVGDPKEINHCYK